MKKYVFICLLAVVALCLTGCESNGPQFHKKTIDLKMTQNDWQFDNQSGRFFCQFNMPEITESVYNYGSWTISREYNYGTPNAYQVILPESSYYKEDVGNGNYAYYTQHIDYVVGVGFVEIDYIISDFYYPAQFVPEAMNFRMQLVY
jgi:hypothetical protein